MDLPSLLSVNESFFPHDGGAERRAFETLSRLSQKGFNVKVLTNPFPNEVEIPGLDIEYVTDLREGKYFKNSSRKVLGVRRFTSAIKHKLKSDHSQDLYIFDEFPLLPAIKGASELPDTKAKFLTWHEVLEDFYMERGNFWRIAARWVRQVAHVFKNNIAVSNKVAALLERKYSTPPASVIENGVNVKEFVANGVKHWGKVIYAGRLEPHKRLDQLISSFHNLDNVNLEIVGGGSQLEHIRKQCQGSKNIKILGHLEREELISRLKESWLFLMPSLREGFSIASLEAMAASVPVMTIQSQYNLAANEVIRDGTNGIIAKDFNDMKERINMLYTDNDAWKNLSANAAKFSKKYDWGVISDRLSKALLSAW